MNFKKERLFEVFKFIKARPFEIILFLIITTALFCRFQAFFLKVGLRFDEAALACNFLDKNGFLWTFLPLNYEQVAPPLFLFFTKILTLLFGFEEKVLKAIPLVSSLFSVFVFYFLSKKFLNFKPAQIFANFLFAINFILIGYASEFKQYSGDILFFSLSLLLFSKIDIKTFNWKKSIAAGLLGAALFFVSQPVVFVFFGFVLYNFKFFLKPKNWAFPLILALFILPYKFFMPNQTIQFMGEYWDYAFISSFRLTELVKINLDFFTYEGKYLYALLPFCCLGCGTFCIKSFKENIVEGKIFLYALFGALLASFLRQYPFSTRLIAYLIPFFIIFTAAFFQEIYFLIKNETAKKLYSSGLCAFITLALILFWMGKICKHSITALSVAANTGTVTKILIENFDSKEDFLIIPTLENTIYSYYSRLYGAKIPSNRIISLNSSDKTAFKRELSALKNEKNGKAYWFYLAEDRFLDPALPAIQEALRGTKPEFELKLGYQSYLFKARF